MSRSKSSRLRHRQAVSKRNGGKPVYRDMFVVYWPPLRSYLMPGDGVLWTKREPEANHFHTRAAARKACKRLEIRRDVRIKPRRTRV